MGHIGIYAKIVSTFARVGVLQAASLIHATAGQIGSHAGHGDMSVTISNIIKIKID